MADYNNQNGLVDGHIPANTGCPFISDCNWKNEHCPSASNPKPIAFSCAAARLHSICISRKQGPETILGKVRAHFDPIQGKIVAR